MSERSELELVVLGIVWKFGPCTPYAIRREFLTSPTPHFSGSAGTIYPLVRRLEKDGLLDSEASRQGKRRSRHYRITRSGRAALRSWLRPPIPQPDAAASYDPLRTRIYFLEALTPKQRRAYLDAAITEIDRQGPALDADEQRYAETTDVFSQLAARGIRRSLEARRAWLLEVRRTLMARSLA